MRRGRRGGEYGVVVGGDRGDGIEEGGGGVKRRWEAPGWRGDGAESAGGVEGSRADPVDLTGDEGDGGGARKVLGSGQGRGEESAQVAGVRWVFKGAAVHRTKDASVGGHGRKRRVGGIKSGLWLWIVELGV